MIIIECQTCHGTMLSPLENNGKPQGILLICCHCRAVNLFIHGMQTSISGMNPSDISEELIDELFDGTIESIETFRGQIKEMFRQAVDLSYIRDTGLDVDLSELDNPHQCWRELDGK